MGNDDMGKDGNWRHRPRRGDPAAGGRPYPVHSAALVSEHFKTPCQIAETLFPPIEIKAEETIASDYFIPDLPRGSGLICGGLERQAQ